MKKDNSYAMWKCNVAIRNAGATVGEVVEAFKRLGRVMMGFEEISQNAQNAQT